MSIRTPWKSIRWSVIALTLVVGAGGWVLPKVSAGSQESKSQGDGPDISFSKDIVTLFKDQKCIVCHRGENPSGLDLAENPYKNLVNAKAQEDKDAVLVKPGDPDASYLYQKLIGPGKDGTIMPPKGKMDETELKKVWSWIKQGAKEN